MMRKVSSEVDLFLQQIHNQRYGSSLICSTTKQLSKFTLFPYTTLFRSIANLRAGSILSAFGGVILPSGNRTHGLGAGVTTLDRKSTRLNSSHTVISYAVFCLKKKKSAFYQLINHTDDAQG